MHLEKRYRPAGDFIIEDADLRRSTEARVHLHSPCTRRGRDPRMVVVFGAADLAPDLGTAACAHKRARIVH
jgi:hypothetical protein